MASYETGEKTEYFFDDTLSWHKKILGALSLLRPRSRGWETWKGIMDIAQMGEVEVVSSPASETKKEADNEAVLDTLDMDAEIAVIQNFLQDQDKLNQQNNSVAARIGRFFTALWTEGGRTAAVAGNIHLSHEDNSPGEISPLE